MATCTSGTRTVPSLATLAWTTAAVAAVEAMPVPFDSGIRAADGSPERKNLLAAIEALEALSEQVSSSARLFGYFLPTEPQG